MTSKIFYLVLVACLLAYFTQVQAMENPKETEKKESEITKTEQEKAIAEDSEEIASRNLRNLRNLRVAEQTAGKESSEGVPGESSETKGAESKEAESKEGAEAESKAASEKKDADGSDVVAEEEKSEKAAINPSI